MASEFTPARAGQRVPPVSLAELVDGEVTRVPLERLLAGRRAIIIGVPGAFTPVCSQRHVPEFVRKADILKASGFDMILCVSANDPWTLAAWSQQVDPQGKLRFLSDGNLTFGRQTGLIDSHPELFLGERLRRFVLTVKDAVIEHIGVEPGLMTMDCSRPQHVVLAA